MKYLSQRRRPLLQLAAAIGLGLVFSAHAQAPWPNKPIRLLVGFPPGGAVDQMARIVAHGLTESLGQPVVIESKTGASGNLAAGEVVRSAPDGLTLLVSSSSVETSNPFLIKSTFDPAKELTAIGTIGRTAMYVVARPGFNGNDAKALVAFGKANPGRLSYASPGTGTPPHLASELFKQQAGFTAIHIPYRGAAIALNDVMGSQVDYVLDPGIAFPHIKAGKVKLLGVVSTKRSPFFPDVPTLSEQGIKGVEVDVWFGMWAPRGIAPELAARIQQELAKILALPATKQRFAEMGAEPAVLDGVAFRKLLTQERVVFQKLIRERNITLD
jgi:tripartite-type tricarboxylate transporter receptor subunit TctC